MSSGSFGIAVFSVPFSNSNSKNVPAAVPEGHATSPQNISITLTAQLQMSVRRVNGFFNACSGEQYAGVIPPLLTKMLRPSPILPFSHSPILPIFPSSPAAARAFANPKSVTFAVPSRVIITLAGFTSW